MTRIVVVSAGLGEPSTTRMLADRLAESVGRRVVTPSVETVNLRGLAHQITDAALTGFAAPELQHVYDQLTAADAVIVSVPVFKASYPGLFKSFIDALDNDALAGVPVLVAATGGSARHSLVIDHALRPLFSHLRAYVVPTGVYAGPQDWSDPALQRRIDRAATELADLLAGRGSARTHADEGIDLFSDTMLSISNPGL